MLAAAVVAQYVLWFGCEPVGQGTLERDAGRWRWSSTLGAVRTWAEAEVAGDWTLLSAQGERRGPAGARSAKVSGGRVWRSGLDGATEIALPLDALPSLAFEAWALGGQGGCRTVVDEASGAIDRACAKPAVSEGAGRARIEGEMLGVGYTVHLAADGLPNSYLFTGLPAVWLRGAGAQPACAALGGVRLPLAPPARARLTTDEKRALSRLAGAAAAGDVSCLVASRRFKEQARAAGYQARLLVGLVQTGPHAWVEVLLRGAWVPVDPALGEVPARSPRTNLGSALDSPEAELAAGALLGLELAR